MDEKAAHIVCLLLIIAIIVLIIHYGMTCGKSSERFSYPLCESSGGYPSYYGSLPPLLPVAAQLGVNYTTSVNNPYANMYSSLYVPSYEGFALGDGTNNCPVFLMTASRNSSTPNYIAGSVPWNVNP